jgi:hypothetical protein
VLVIGAQAGADPVTLEKPPRVPGVLAEHEVGVGELAEHAQGDVLQVADRGRADREHRARYASSW